MNNNRIQHAQALRKQVTHKGNILLLGCGAVARASLPLLFQLVDFDPKKLTIIDFVDVQDKISAYLEMGVNVVKETITPENYQTLLSQYVKQGDLILDLSWNIDTCDLLEFCHQHGVLYVNTSLEVWEPYKTSITRQGATLYDRHQRMRKMIQNWGNATTQPTAILDHGANPGIISHLVKKGIEDIIRLKLIPSKELSDSYKERLLKHIEHNYFNLLAQEIGLKVVHTSERDTQITHQPKRPDEFINTWSVEGIIEEGLAPAELGWGTHEQTLPHTACTHAEGNKNKIFLQSRGFTTLMKSWIKSGPIQGMLIRHGESYGISDRFSVYPNETPASYIHNPFRHTDRSTAAIYRPTVYYVYCVNDGALASVHEFRMHNYVRQTNQRIMYSDIISGKDELGCLLVGSFGLWWTGSLLDIEETREIINPQTNQINATTLQVASGAVAAVIYAMRHPNVGICLPDDIDHREILELAAPFWGPMWSGEITITPEEAKKINGYQFESFHVTELD